ncbi:MAG: hypothetical protein RLZZ08_1749 [Pseudomonadota bacterium]
MAEWLIEQGIGEDRAILLENGEIAAARVQWPDAICSGMIASARLLSRPRGATRGTALLASGAEVLVDRLPASAIEGSTLTIEITRPALSEGTRIKRAQGRATDAAARPAPSLEQRLAAEGHQARIVHRFPEGDWDGLMAEAFAREAAFTGGALVFSPTPAMLLVDVDGTLSPASLALAAVRPLADALRRFDIGGSIGIDFPTLAAKDDRRAVDTALTAALAGWPHEQTAMNGFGFIQLVARLERPSLLHLAAHRTAAAAWRQVLRRAEALEGAGAIELVINPVLDREADTAMIAELARRTGREVRLRRDPALAPEAPHAQMVPR